MANVVTCPSCNRSLRVPDDLVGTTVQCPSCQKTFKANVDDGGVEERPRQRSRENDADDDEDRPSRRRNLAPHRGDMIQLMGILAFIPVFGLPFILGPIAWIMGRSDLKEMDAGRMDPAGRDATQTGKTCGKLAVIIWGSIACAIFLLWLTIVIVMFIIYGTILGAGCCCFSAGVGGAAGGGPH